MQTWEADSIADKLCHSWPRSSISAKAWTDELADLQRGRAEEAARQLVRSSEHAPSIAAFLSMYRNLAGSADPTFECPDCANSGWVTDTNHPAHWPGRHPEPNKLQPDGTHRDEPGNIPPIPASFGPADGCCCNVVRPCRCDHGDRARKQAQRPNKDQQ
jgi:hypothetical protein